MELHREIFFKRFTELTKNIDYCFQLYLIGGIVSFFTTGNYILSSTHVIIVYLFLYFSSKNYNHIKENYVFNYMRISYFVRLISLFIIVTFGYFVVYGSILLFQDFKIYDLLVILSNIIIILSLFRFFYEYPTVANIIYEFNKEEIVLTDYEWNDFMKRHHLS